MKILARSGFPLIASIFLTFPAFGGDDAQIKNPLPVCSVPFSGSVLTGYDSDFIFRGQNLGDHAVTGAVDLDYLVSQGLNLNLSSTYVNVAGTPEELDRLDSRAFAEFLFGPLDAGIGANWYYFPESSSALPDYLEGGLTLGRDLGVAYLGFGYFYDFEAEGSYFELGIDKVIQLGKCLHLNLGTGIGYGTEDYVAGGLTNGGDHVYVVGGLIYQLTQAANLNAYVAGNFLYDDLEAALPLHDDEFYGGVSLQVSF